ncbi:putative polypeptide N-acetylgalactosaminyltransferase 8 [Tupaia chinensis]|uniref:Polypeptide N-acetylgalactosaminyltransferase n=1 Tax=Tupaia chinensis TaxID=246437 RepID=L8Y2J3_TUPCH|nr:putative polypeptide N-acetylgalactosaminyltransferase 8 [Tupaia chinensis]
MMFRRNFPKVLCIGLILAIAINLLVFYSRGTSQISLLGHKELQLPLSEREGEVVKRLSHLEADLQHLKESMKLALKQQESMNSTLTRVKVEVRSVQNAVKSTESEAQKRKPQKKLFPHSQLFKQWGDDLSEAEQQKAQDLFEKFGYNVYLSDRLPLNRTIPDTRDSRCLRKTYSSQLPSLSVVLIFMNEALSIIERAVTSVINRTPSRLLKEIILVDDFSTNELQPYVRLAEELKTYLDEKITLYNHQYPGLLKIIRHAERKGLAQARNTGWEAATADVVAILDAHIEVNIGWAEPILARIQEDRTVVVSPVFDNIRFDTFILSKYELAVDGFNWELWCRYDALPQAWIDLQDVTAPVKSPSIMGILAANRLFLGEIGSLDGGMLVYGGENVELSLRVWQCGGKIEVLPCSRIAHLERSHKPYALDLSPALKRNALRVAEIWMGEHKHMVYLAWNIPLQMKNTLDRTICVDRGPVPGNIPIMYPCHEFSPQNVYYHLTGEFYVGPLVAEATAADHCLTDPGSGEKPTLEPCSEAARKGLHIHWDFKQEGAAVNRDTKRCLEIEKDASSAYVLVLQTCTSQVWELQHTVGSWGHAHAP